MSKIKDLYAIEEGIDDLMPVAKPTYKYVAEQAVKLVASKSEDFRNYLWENMALSSGTDENGNCEYHFANFTTLCELEARDVIDIVLEDQEIDLSDEDYAKAATLAGDILANEYADLESELIAEGVDATKEEWAQRQAYNSATLPNN